MTPVLKQPAETKPIEVAATLPTGATIASADVVVSARGLVTGPALAAGAPSWSGATVSVPVSAGADGEVYLLTVTVTTDAADVIEAEAEIHVLDLTFAVPDAGAGTYIDPSDYVDRFGLAELVDLTDRTGADRADKGALFAALADAGAEIDGHLATRFTVPISPIPALIRAIAADLTRQRLHGLHVPDAVASATEHARSQLKALSAGRMTLPGAAVVNGGTSAPQISAGAKVFTDAALEGF